jgi:hypothetical protein
MFYWFIAQVGIKFWSVTLFGRNLKIHYAIKQDGLNPHFTEIPICPSSVAGILWRNYEKSEMGLVDY